MGVNFVDVVKDNKKPLLSMLGVMAMAIIITIAIGSGGIPGFSTAGDPIDNLIDGNTANSSKAPTMQLTNSNYFATISTNYGDITVDLYEKETPVTVNSFVDLSKKGFYNNLTFHRVIKNFVIQGGDPTGSGSGGPGYTIKDEIVPSLTFSPYVLAMANAGPNTNGSQFFITTKNFSQGSSLDGKYTIFGRVTAGFDVVDAIENVGTNASDKPINTVKINTVKIVEK